MSYESDYKERIAKKHSTKIYSDEELEKIKFLIKNYYEIEFPDISLNTNEAYFHSLAEAINKSHFKDRDVIKAKYLCQIYNGSNMSKKKSIEKITNIRKFLLDWLGLHKKDAGQVNDQEVENFNSWNAKTNESTPQWTDYISVPLKNKVFKRIQFEVITKTKYYRLGFKFLRQEGKLFGDGSIQSQDNNFVIHIGKNFMDKDIFITAYKNGILERRDKYTNIIPLNNRYNCELFIDTEDFLYLLINDQEVYKNLINKEICSRLYMLAWGDGNEYSIKVKNIKINLGRA